MKWQLCVSGTSSFLNNVCYEADAFLTAGPGEVVLISTNGITWAPRPSPANSIIGPLHPNDEVSRTGVAKTPRLPAAE
jgi:hypothetical protein